MTPLTTVFVGCFVAVLTPAILVLRYRTVLFGFTMFGFANLAFGSLSAFLLGRLFGLDEQWITPEHYRVFEYSAAGLVAYVAGAAVAWRGHPGLRSGGELILGAWISARHAKQLAVLGLAASILVPVAFAFPTLRSFWSGLVSLTQIAMLIAIVGAHERQNYGTVVFCSTIFLISSLYFALISGFIGAAGLFMTQLLFVGCFWRGLTFRNAIFGAVGSLLLVSLFGGWMSARSTLRQAASSDLATRASDFASSFQPPEGSPRAIQDLVRSRLDQSGVLAAQVSIQPDVVPFQNGATLTDELLAAFVPRVLWTDKPVILGGSDFVSKYSGMHWTEGTSVGLPYYFELYANWGVVGVVLGLFALGWLTARAELATLAAGSLSRGLPIAAIALVLAGGAQHFVALLTTLVTTAIAYWLAASLLTVIEFIRDRGQQLNLSRAAITAPAQVPAGHSSIRALDPRQRLQ